MNSEPSSEMEDPNKEQEALNRRMFLRSVGNGPLRRSPRWDLVLSGWQAHQRPRPGFGLTAGVLGVAADGSTAGVREAGGSTAGVLGEAGG